MSSVSDHWYLERIGSRGDRAAFLWDDGSITYDQLHNKCVDWLDQLQQKNIGQGDVASTAFVNEMVLKTLQSKRTVRINVYPNGKTTANGRVVASPDHRARNGVIHVLDDVMSSVYKRAGSVVSELDECCEDQTDFIGLIRDSGLYEMLDETGPFTLIAPNNA